MTAAIRKGVLLRFKPELLERVDRCRGGLSRTEWLLQLIEREVIAIEHAQGEEHAYVPPAGGSCCVHDEDGSDMGLRATRTGDGAVCEISAAPPAASEYSTATDAQGDSGLDGESSLGSPADPDALESPDISASTEFVS